MSDLENLQSSEIYSQGVRSYIGGDFSKALEYLSKACKLIASEKSDVCDELFEPYFHYAKALYMYSKYSSDIIGGGVSNALPDDEKNVSNESDPVKDIVKVKNDGKIQDEKEIKEDAAEDEKIIIQDEASDSEEINEDVIETDECKEDINETDECKEDINETEECDNVDNQSDQEEDIGYLQMAYETIECAKLIISRQLSEGILDKKDLELKLADCCDVAADIYLEEEVMKEAISQYEQALEFRRKHLASFDRAIAESYYKIAVAYNVDYRLPEAKDNFEKCRDILAINKDICVKNSENTEELVSIMSEIDDKIVETKEGIEGYERYKNTLKELLSGRPSGSSSSTIMSTKVNDINHLVKKVVKKPRDTKDDGNEEKPAKITKTNDQ